MTELETKVREFATLLQKGRTLDAMEKYYAPEVTVFENRQLARAGKSRCLEYERDALANQPQAPRFKVGKIAVDQAGGHAFLEYVVRFVASNGRPQRLEEVAVQTWENGLIVQERFYYEGVVDEGDEL